MPRTVADAGRRWVVPPTCPIRDRQDLAGNDEPARNCIADWREIDDKIKAIEAFDWKAIYDAREERAENHVEKFVVGNTADMTGDSPERTTWDVTTGMGMIPAVQPT